MLFSTQAGNVFFLFEQEKTFEQEKIIAGLASITARDLLSMDDVDEFEAELTTTRGRANHETAQSPLSLRRRPQPPAAHALSPRRGGCCSLKLRRTLP